MSFLRIIYYKLKIFLGNKTLLVLSAIVCLLTAFITGYSYQKTTHEGIPIAIVDFDSSTYSELLLDRIAQNDSLVVFVTDMTQGEYLLKKSRVEMLFSINDGFEENIKQMEYENIIDSFIHINSLNSPFIKEIIASNVNRFISNHYTVSLVRQNLNRHNIEFKDYMEQKIIETSDSNWDPPLASHKFSWAKTSSLQSNSNTNDNLNQNIYHGAILFILILIILFGTSFVIEEKSNHIQKRLSSTRRNFIKNYIANILALFFGAFLYLLSMHLLITIVFRVDIINTPSNLIIYISYIFSTIFISLNIGSLLKNATNIKSYSAPLAIISSFAGGCFFNLSYVSKNAYFLSLLTPQGIALRGFSRNVYTSVTSLILITLFFLTLDILIQSTNFKKGKQLHSN